jgi:lysine 2,3-aminomutase
METWECLVKESITTPEALAKFLNVDVAEIKLVHKDFPLRINPYYLSLIKKKDDAIWKQAVPDVKELTTTGFDDPLSEEEQSPVPNLVHRYPDRVLLYVSAVCSMYCRFCTRKRKVGDPESIPRNALEMGFEYIRKHAEIRDVIISGGDPLMLSDERIDYILKNLRAIPHVQIIRIGSRMPVTLPQRITENLCAILKKHHPLYVNTHFNHPDEITPESSKACAMLADSGIPLGNQSVLLKGINDNPGIMKKLVQKLLAIRVRPYYIYQADLVKGTDHFRTSVQTGLNIIKALRGFTSGLAVPHYVIDAPGGGGKIAVIPEPVVAYEHDGTVVLRNFKGALCRYPKKKPLHVFESILVEESIHDLC